METKRNSVRNTGFDVIKMVSAYAVVCLHATYPNGAFGESVRVLSRVAVPFFFMISGYYAYSSQPKTREKSIVKMRNHFFTLLLLSAAYIFIYGFSDLIKLQFPRSVRSSILSVKWLLTNMGLAGHLWFLRALLYMEIFMFLFEGWIRKIDLKCPLALLWITDVLLFKYSGLLFGFTIPQPYNEIITKYLLNACLYYLAGYYIRKNEYRFKQKARHITIGRHSLVLAVLAALNIREYFFLENLGANTMPVNYIFTMPLTISTFMFGLLNPRLGEGSHLADWGQSISMYIYYWNPLLIRIGRKAASIIGNKAPFFKIWMTDNFFVIYAEALVLGLLIAALKKKWKRNGVRLLR